MSVRVHPIGREAGRAIEAAGSRHDSMRKALEYYLAYADESKSPGFWVGAGAEVCFGFPPGTPVERDAFVAVMTVRDPATGELLSPRTKNLIRRDRRPGFDLVFRMERSAALAFVACPEARPAIRAAHEEAIRQAVRYFEHELLVAKSATDATGRPMRTDGLIAAGFHHYANRAGDPDLHTHVIVANLVRRTDGTWATFAAGKLMGAASTLSAIYHMAFFAEIERVFGAEIRRDPQTGYRRLAAVPDAAVAEFLRRTQEVDAYVEEMGWPDTPEARQAAVIATRRSKAEAELRADERSWRQRMAAVGVTKDSISKALNLPPDSTPAPAAAPVMSPAQLAQAELRVLVRLATAGRPRIYREQVVREWARELDGVGEVATLLALVDHTMVEGRGLLRRVARDRDGAALYMAAPIEVLRRRFGATAVAEAVSFEHAAVPGREPEAVASRPVDVANGQVNPNSQNASTPRSGQAVRRYAGYVVFEAPLSVALYVAFALDRTVAAQLEEAHRRAVAEVAEAILSATGHPGRQRRLPPLAEEARRGTRGEARLATKVFFPGVDVYAWSHAAGALYRAALRAHARAAGIFFEAAGSGFELSGAGALANFDGRHLLDTLSRRGSVPAFHAGAEVPGGPEAPEVDAAVWARLGRSVEGLAGVPLAVAVDNALGSSSPLTKRAVWTQADFLCALDAQLPEGCTTATMLEVAATLGLRGEVVALDPVVAGTDGAVPGGDAHIAARKSAVDLLARFALKGLVADEEAVLAACARTHTGVVSARAIRHAEKTGGVPLSGEQRRAVEVVLSDGRAVSAIAGVPGAGKTTVLAAIARGFAEAGFEVTGLAHTGVASETLGRHARIACSTIDSFLFRLARGSKRISSRSVLICDEASQVDTARMRALTAEAAATGAKLVLVGDPLQQGSVEAGGLFTEIVSRQGAAVLLSNRRQRCAHEVDAIAALRRGDGAGAVQSYVDHNQVRVTRSHAEMLQGAVDEFAALRVRGADAILIAQRKTDVAALNSLARSSLVATGILDDARGTTIEADVPVAAAPGESLRMTARRQVVDVHLAKRTRVGDVVFGKGEDVTVLIDGPVVTIASRTGVATAARSSLPRLRRLREKELARCRASGISPAALAGLSGLGSLRGAKSLRRGSVVEVTEVAGEVLFLRTEGTEIAVSRQALSGAVEHAYAWTAATAQSQTVGSAGRSGYAVVVGADEMGPEEALVALSRARDGTTLWACVENQATATWSRKRTEAADTLLAAIDELEQRDPKSAALVSLVSGANAEPLNPRAAGAALGLDLAETAMLARRCAAALLAGPGVAETLAIPEPPRPGSEARQVLAAARRIFDERARDPLFRMADRWGASAAGEHAASTELRHRAEAHNPARARQRQAEDARAFEAVASFVRGPGAPGAAMHPAPGDSGARSSSDHRRLSSNGRGFQAVPVSQAAGAAEASSRRTAPPARAGTSCLVPAAVAGVGDSRTERVRRDASQATVRSRSERNVRPLGRQLPPGTSTAGLDALGKAAGDNSSVPVAGNGREGAATPIPGRGAAARGTSGFASARAKDARADPARPQGADEVGRPDPRAAEVSLSVVEALYALRECARDLARFRPMSLAIRDAYSRLAATDPAVAAELDRALGGRGAAVRALVDIPGRPHALGAADRRVLAGLSRVVARLAVAYGETEAVMLVVSYATGDGAATCSAAVRRIGGPIHLALALVAARTGISGSTAPSVFTPTMASTAAVESRSGPSLGP